MDWSVWTKLRSINSAALFVDARDVAGLDLGHASGGDAHLGGDLNPRQDPPLVRVRQ
jgi:hypothetical protein